MEIRLATRDDILACNQFHNRAYGAARSSAQWCWEFASPLLPDEIIPYALVVDQGKVVGTQALIPIRMVDQGGVYWTAKSEETLLDPEYRGRSLFESMYALLLDYARRRNIRSVWGFTPATKAFSRMGFLIPGQSEQLFYPFRGEAGAALVDHKFRTHKGRLTKLGVTAGIALAAAYSSLKSSFAGGSARSWADSAGVDLRTLDHPPAEAADLCRRFIARRGGTTIFRDEAYLRWRLFLNPYVRALVRAAYVDGRLLGYSAWAVGEDTMGYLVDLFICVDSDDARDDARLARLLLSDGIAQLGATGVAGVRGWRFNAHPFDLVVTKAAKDVGFFHLRRGHAVVILPLDPTAERLPDHWYDRWYISRIYSEGLVG